MITQAYFENIQPQIFKELLKAKSSIYIAVAWFTDDSLYDVLVQKAKSGVSVSMLVLRDDINCGTFGLDFSTLKETGGEVQLIESGNELMHNKFCIIDQETVITGSYNWTKKAKTNDENITITKGSKEFATDFVLEFQRLQQKYFGKTSKIRLDLETIVKRLEILKNSIVLQDEDDIQYNTKKLTKILTIKEVPDELDVIQIIIDKIHRESFSDAVKLITEFLDRCQSLVMWVDPEISGLKLEIHSLEIQISSLEDEKADIEKKIFDFEYKYNTYLGSLILDYHDLKRKAAAKKFRENPEDEQAKREFDEINNEYEDFRSSINASKKIDYINLDSDQLQELKTKFRAITKLTHPDLVDKKFEKEATELFIRAKEAKDRNDLKTINEILEQLSKGKHFKLKHETISEKELLKLEAVRLREILKKLIEDISSIKNSGTYLTLCKITDIQLYLDNIKKKLKEELAILTNTQN